MRKSEWVERTAQELGLSQAQTEKTLNAAMAQIGTCLAQGDFLRLPGFGTLSTTRVEAYQGRNPQTGEPMQVPARTRIMFKASQALREAVQPRVKATRPKTSKPKTATTSTTKKRNKTKK